MHAAFIFTPWESKRLIGQAVAKLPEVERALLNSQIIISHGTTNIFVAEEILGRCPDRERFISGQVINRTFCQTQPEEKPEILRLKYGRPVKAVSTMQETMAGWDDSCIFIKGANAVDPEFNAGVFNAHPAGGTIGFALGAIHAQGIPLIVPVGLEKLVPSIKEAANHLGQSRVQYFSGLKVGMTPLYNAKVITEIQALEILFGVRAVHVGGGGAAGSEGSVTIVVNGEDDVVRSAIEGYESIRGEPAVISQKARCETCQPTAPGKLAAQPYNHRNESLRSCPYQGLKEKDLPNWFSRRDDRAHTSR